MKRISISPIFLFLLIFLPACSLRAQDGSRQVCFDDQCIRAEVVQTLEARGRGLQFRESLGQDRGMLFIFSASRPHSFWMKNTLIPLDIIWMDHNRRIVFIASNVLPCKTEQCPVYAPGRNAAYVLEVNAGVAVEFGLNIGDQAVFR